MKKERSSAGEQQAVMALQAEIYAQELKKLEQEYQQLMLRIADIENTIKALDFVNVKKSFSALSPLGSGIYMKVNVDDVSEVLVSITTKYAIKMKASEARKFLEEMKVRLEEAAKSVEKDFLTLDTQLQQIVAKMQSTQK